MCERPSLGFGPMDPKSSFAKIGKDEEASFDADWGILKSRIEILFFAQRRRKLADNSFRRLIDDEKSDFDVDISAILCKNGELLLGKIWHSPKIISLEMGPNNNQG